MRDQPDGAALLALAREVLDGERPPGRCADRRLARRAIDIAERERAAGDRHFAAAERELAAFYATPLTPSLSPQGGDRENALWRRFARDLRAGAFEGDAARARAARALLWRLTVARLRIANPQFLAANGLA
jgi:hypothetical protein